RVAGVRVRRLRPRPWPASTSGALDLHRRRRPAACARLARAPIDDRSAPTDARRRLPDGGGDQAGGRRTRPLRGGLLADQHAALALVREPAGRFQPAPLPLLPADVPDRSALLRWRPPARHPLRLPLRADPGRAGRRRWSPPASLALGPALYRPRRALP